ncbi:MAG TPA: AsmA-like C-terminal region-containing protein, partial [Burkholderiales bacterium]|nr:AsmA-like C-terminal region-containing protein [Burkholderiales bacterium]
LKNALPGTGRIAGDIAIALDRRNPALATAEGKLSGANVDLEWLAGRPLRIQRLDVAAHQLGLRIGEITLELDGQPATLSGDIQRTPEGPVIDARLESPGIVVDKLLRPAAEKKPEKTSLWPLPVTGRIEVAAGFIEHQKRRVAPVQGTLRLEAQRARIELREARMCGVSFPLELEAKPDGYTANVHLEMKKEPLEKAVVCLSGEKVQITGVTDLRAELVTRGKVDELLRNLTGTVRLDVSDGRLEKFELLGSILSMANFSNITELHKAAAAGIPYRTIMVGGHFEGGQFVVEEAGFDSNALRLAASGRVGIAEPDTQLTVLVAPLARVDRLVGAIPILGNVLGGVLTTVPVAVSGDIRDPRVVPLGPHAVTDQLLGVFERTLKLPAKLVVPPQQ